MLRRVPIPSPHYSSRGGQRVRLVVLHTAEGSRTYQSLGSWFQNPASKVSSHVGIDDTPGTVGEYVRPDGSAWTAASFNPVSVQAELCAFAAWTPEQWSLHETMLQTTAAWIAEECVRFGIPVRRLTAAQAQGGQSGVCQHVDLGAGGGGHWDCGPGFPMDRVIGMALGRPTESQEDEGEMIATTDGDGYWTATKDGAVYAFGDAQYKGNALGKVTGRVVGIAGRGKDGYVLLGSDGGVFAFGSSNFHGRPDRV